MKKLVKLFPILALKNPDRSKNSYSSNPELQVRLHHLTTSKIGNEKQPKHRINNKPTLEAWRKLAKSGNLAPLRKILESSKLLKQTKKYIRELDDTDFREKFLKRIHFDCGALDSKFLLNQLQAKLYKLVKERGGGHTQVSNFLNSILTTLLQKATQKSDRSVNRNMLEELLEKATQIQISIAQFDALNQLAIKALSRSVSQSTSLVATRIKFYMLSKIHLRKVMQ